MYRHTFFCPHLFLWPLPTCEEAAASWVYDIVCSLNSESRDFVWLPGGGVLRPVPRMWDPCVPPAHTLLLRFLRASYAFSDLGAGFFFTGVLLTYLIRHFFFLSLTPLGWLIDDWIFLRGPRHCLVRARLYTWWYCLADILLTANAAHALCVRIYS